MSNRLSYRASMASDNGARVQPEMFKHRLLQLGEETLNSLQEIWKEAGYEEVECQRLLGDFLNKLKQTCTNELEAEQQILEHAKAEVISKSADFHDFCERLGRQCSIDYIDNMNYADKLAELEKLIAEISTEVNQRQSVLDAEMNKIVELVESLGENPPNADEFSGPEGTPKLSDVRLQLMREYVGDLETIKAQRTEDVKSIIQDCHKHMSDLMYVEENFSTMEDSEKYHTMDNQIHSFFQNGDFTFSLRKKDIAALTLRLKSFAEEKERRRADLARAGAEIAKLWTLLRIPSAEREKFQSSFKMNLSMETLTKGHEELERLREIRKTSMAKVVGTIRSDILALWEEAGIESEEQRREEFPLFFEEIEALEDSAVEIHEDYFGAMRKRVEELRPLLQKIARREAIVQERIELEHLMMKPERLNNRGPSAREERKKEEGMTNRVRNLDKVTRELLGQIAAWEENNQSQAPFSYGGESYADRVTQQDEAYIEIRDSLRAERKKNNGKPAAEPTPSMKTLAPLKKQSSSHSHSGGASGHSTPSSTPKTRGAPHGHTHGTATTINNNLPTVPAAASVVTNAALHAASAPPPPPAGKTNPVQVHGKSHLPTPKSRSGSVVMAAGKLAAVSMDVADENSAPGASRNSSESEGTLYTSATEVRERPLSNGSHTVVREA